MAYADQEARLSPKQHKFVQAIIKGSTIQEAYGKAGYNTGSHNAARLKDKEAVRSAIKAARAEAAARTVATAAQIAEDLDEIRLLAISDGQYAAAVAAALGRAKILGLYVDRREVEILHRPAPLPTNVLELTEDQWRRQFALPAGVTTAEIRDAVENAGLSDDELPEFMR
jgi:hypothetical protein